MAILFKNNITADTVAAATIGEAKDQAEIAKYREAYFITLAGELTTEADADNRASAILTRAKSEILGGQLIIPHDCGVELYDKVAVYDVRGT